MPLLHAPSQDAIHTTCKDVSMYFWCSWNGWSRYNICNVKLNKFMVCACRCIRSGSHGSDDRSSLHGGVGRGHGHAISSRSKPFTESHLHSGWLTGGCGQQQLLLHPRHSKPPALWSGQGWQATHWPLLQWQNHPRLSQWVEKINHLLPTLAAFILIPTETGMVMVCGMISRWAWHWFWVNYNLCRWSVGKPIPTPSVGSGGQRS